MKLYVGTYHKYNNGSLEGRWIDLNHFDCKKEFLVTCKNLHGDEDDPELMFQDNDYCYDWENAFYSESYISDEYWEVKNELARCGLDDDIFSTWYNIHGGDITVESVAKCQNEYRGVYGSLENYVEEFFEETGELEQVPRSLRGYIDFSQIARDWEYSDIHCVDGYVFEG